MDLHPSDWPAEFVCPISRSVMADPVIVASGQTYERRCIEAWLDLGQSRCVKQNTPLDRNFIIPNAALKAAIANMVRSKGIQIVPIPPSPELALGLAKHLISELQASNHSIQEPGFGKRGADRELGFLNEEKIEKKKQESFINEQEEKEVEEDDIYKMESLAIRDENRRNFIKSSSGLHPMDAHQRNIARGATDPGHISSETFERFRSSSEHGGGSSDGYGRYSRTDGRRADPIRTRYSHSASGEAVLEASYGRCELPPHLATKPSSYSSSEVPHPQPSSSFSPSPTDSLIQRLQDAQEEQEAAVVELRQLTRLSAENRLSLCHRDIIQALLPLLRSENPSIQINSVAAIVNLSLEKANKVIIVRAGAVPFLVEVLNNGFPEAQEHAAGAFFSLALADENKHPIGVLNAIPPLINLLYSGPPRTRQDAAMALYHLSLLQTNRSKLVKVGAIPLLLNLAESQDRPDLASRSLLILSNAAAIPEGRATLLELNAVTTLVKLLAPQANKKAADIPEQAAAVLLLLSKDNLRFKSMALHAGAQELLTALLDDGTPRAREKALALLAIMKESSSGPDDLDADSILSRQYLRRNMGRTEGMQMNSSAF